jgi:hypothetical protein
VPSVTPTGLQWNARLSGISCAFWHSQKAPSMEYVNGMFVNNIAHYFKQSAAVIKSKKQALIAADS